MEASKSKDFGDSVSKILQDDSRAMSRASQMSPRRLLTTQATLRVRWGFHFSPKICSALIRNSAVRDSTALRHQPYYCVQSLSYSPQQNADVYHHVGTKPETELLHKHLLDQKKRLVDPPCRTFQSVWI